MERAPSWLLYVFVLDMGSNEEEVEAEPREAGCSIVATDISAADCDFDLVDLDRSRALDTRVGTSDRSDELI